MAKEIVIKLTLDGSDIQAQVDKLQQALNGITINPTINPNINVSSGNGGTQSSNIPPNISPNIPPPSQPSSTPYQQQSYQPGQISMISVDNLKTLDMLKIALKDAQKEMSTLEIGSDRFKASMSRVTDINAKIKSINDEMKALAKGINNTGQELEHLSTNGSVSLLKQKDTLNGLIERYKLLKENFSNMDLKLTDKGELNKAKDELAELDGQIKTIQQSLMGMNTTQVLRQLDRLAQGMAALDSAAKAFASSMALPPDAFYALTKLANIFQQTHGLFKIMSSGMELLENNAAALGKSFNILSQGFAAVTGFMAGFVVGMELAAWAFRDTYVSEKQLNEMTNELALSHNKLAKEIVKNNTAIIIANNSLKESSEIISEHKKVLDDLITKKQEINKLYALETQTIRENMVKQIDDLKAANDKKTGVEKWVQKL